MIRTAVTALAVMLLLGGCSAGDQTPEPSESGPPTSASATRTKTPSATPSPPAQPTAAATAAPEGAVIRGAVCYPSEYIPEMTAFFQDTTSGEVTTLDVAENQATYEVNLPAGTYLAFAYLAETPTLGGAYTVAVPCGLDASCTDHTPLPVTVAAGQTVEGIDLCDWYDQGALPPNPQG